jgi:hypothetical protein
MDACGWEHWPAGVGVTPTDQAVQLNACGVGVDLVGWVAHAGMCGCPATGRRTVRLGGWRP